MNNLEAYVPLTQSVKQSDLKFLLLLRLSITCELYSINGCVFHSHRSSQRTSQKSHVHLNRFTRPYLFVVIGSFPSIVFVSLYQGALNVVIIMIDGSKQCNNIYC